MVVVFVFFFSFPASYLFFLAASLSGGVYLDDALVFMLLLRAYHCFFTISFISPASTVYFCDNGNVIFDIVSECYSN